MDCYPSDKRVIFCSCGGECMVFEKDRDDGALNVSMFSYENYKPYSLWRRIKYAIHIIRTGQPFLDEIILTEDGVRELKHWLEESYNEHTSDA